MPVYRPWILSALSGAVLLFPPASSAFDFDGRGPRFAGARPSAVSVPAASLPAETGQPERSVLKTRTVTFNSGYFLKASGGRVWLRPTAGPGGNGAWSELPVPQEAGRIAQISADGDNLMAVSEAGRVFYMKFSSRKWRLKIGKPFAKELFLPANRAWAVSHLGPETGNYYEDPDGKRIVNKAGVTTLYLLSPDGTRLSYVDPWLQAGFDYHIDMPLRGRFRAEALSASASTIFLIGPGGRMFTRLADFDTLGCDPLFAYSFEPSDKPGVIRLPGEDWREQPRIAGRITRNITIVQNGRGNAARELRVEGLDAAGNGGYYFKAIYSPDWAFARTGVPVEGPFLQGADEPGPSIGGDYGLAYRRLPEGSRLRDFSPLNRLAEIIVPGFEGFPLKFHTRETFLPNKPGEAVRLFGTIELPEAVLSSAEPGAAALVRELGGNFREVFATVEKGSVRLHDNLLAGLGAHTGALFGADEER